MEKDLKSFLETLLVGCIGGLIFFLISLPLPWMLGPLTAVMVWQSTTSRKMIWPAHYKNIGLITLGITFGLYFSIESMLLIGPYFLPYVLLTSLMILISIINSSFISKFINVDQVTSVFGSIPGGLTEMVIASESLHAKTSFVMIFQTVRLLVVLFTVPFIIIYAFSGEPNTSVAISEQASTPFLSWTALLLLLPVLLGFRFKEFIPAGVMIVPLVTTGLLNISPLEIPQVPAWLFLAAQLSVGIGLGKNISLNDLRAAGKYGFVFAGLAVWLILIGLGLGFVLAFITSMDLPTAMLSMAPGGLVEMVLTASIVGGDPAIVTSLQLTRILIIVVCVPIGLKWYFKRKMKKTVA
ncbi:hypothetical protein CR203_04605 [Salipaludibacillus neizhouensis]|uniref:AbrB family transcriptional regulator n=1 Tax=Salipaludibacillus neizhouensis TaxID=885475 RepID=A0A3A9KFH0_9BACI|nr:AbrB family transcriptional regulator [Salipaludibacillus neizhouensis]RKL69312.1 hypothetical protein CR203_04605 [Salipaludibacillus neizhouensis]